MNLQESGEMYLESIYVLSQQGQPVRSIDVVEFMGYSKPSVSRAVGLLREGGLLAVSQDGSLHLTEGGVSVARKIYERHILLTDFLVMLGVDKQTAAQDACKMEHHISDQTFEAIKRHAAKQLEENAADNE